MKAAIVFISSFLLSAGWSFGQDVELQPAIPPGDGLVEVPRTFERTPIVKTAEKAPAEVTAAMGAVCRIVNSGGLATGCLLDSGCILTAYHAVNESEKSEIYWRQGACSATLCHYDSVYDVALLKPDSPLPSVPTARLGRCNMEPGQDVYTVGMGEPASGVKVVRRRIGNLVTPRQAANGPLDWLWLTGHCRSGDSGMPIFTGDGEVTGIVWGSNDLESVGVNCGRIVHLSQFCQGGMHQGGVCRPPGRIVLGPPSTAPPRIIRGPAYTRPGGSLPPPAEVQPQQPIAPSQPPKSVEPPKPAEPSVDLEKLAKLIAAEIAKQDAILEKLRGPAGKDGVPGKQGEPGVPGQPGARGAQGERGEKGDSPTKEQVAEAFRILVRADPELQQLLRGEKGDNAQSISADPAKITESLQVSPIFQRMIGQAVLAGIEGLDDQAIANLAGRLPPFWIQKVEVKTKLDGSQVETPVGSPEPVRLGEGLKFRLFPPTPK